MKKIPFTISCLLLSIVFAGTFCGCEEKGGESASSVQNGVVISEETPYTEEVQGYAKGVVFSLLEYYTQKTVVVNLPTATVEKLKRISADICDLMAKTPVSEPLYRAFIDALDKQGKTVIDEVIAYRKGEGSSLETAKTLYMTSASLLGADLVGEILYGICVYKYDYDYEKKNVDYEKYGYAFLLEDAKLLDAERKTLQNGIGKENFLSVIKIAFAFSELFFGGGFQSDKFSSFTDAEMLTFVKKLGLSTLNVTNEGWNLILSKAISDGAIAADDPYALKILKTMKKTGDIAAVSTVMQDVAKLLSDTVEKLDETDAALLRNGDREKLICLLFAKFDETDWARFERVTECDFAVESYEEVAVDTYGENYENYKAGMRSLTLEQLKAAAGQDDFYDSLKGYIAGISPAFSYGMEL